MSNVSNRFRNHEEIISGFQKEDYINNLTKQTLFDHHNNVAMSSNNNTCNLKMMMIKDMWCFLLCKLELTNRLILIID